MTRHTATTRISTAKLTLEVRVERDETSGYRHRWTTTVRFGLLRAIGPNLREALAKLALEIQGLAESPGAEAGAIAERMAAHAHYDADVARFGVEVAAERMRLRVRGLDPDREAIDPSPVQEKP